MSTPDRDDEPDYDISDIVYDVWVDVNCNLRIGDADGDLPDQNEHGDVRYDLLDDDQEDDEDQ